MNHKATTSKVYFFRCDCEFILSRYVCLAWFIQLLIVSLCFHCDYLFVSRVVPLFPYIVGLFSRNIWECFLIKYENTFPQYVGIRQSLDVTMGNLESNTTTPFYWSESLFVTRMPLAQGNEFISEKRVLLLN